MIKKIIRIIRSKTRDKSKIQDNWYKERLTICNSCPLNSKNTDRKNLKYWTLRILNLGEYFCTKCGCEIKAKCSEEMEECPKGKWKQILL